MLIEFTVGNYRSFKEPVTLSMVAAKIKSKKDTNLDSNNVFQTARGVDLLTSAAIYGANASGKSNLIQAFQFMRSFVLNSSRETQVADLIGVESFQLSTETADKPSHFELVFLVDNQQYRYGFDLTFGFGRFSPRLLPKTRGTPRKSLRQTRQKYVSTPQKPSIPGHSTCQTTTNTICST